MLIHVKLEVRREALLARGRTVKIPRPPLASEHDGMKRYARSSTIGVEGAAIFISPANPKDNSFTLWRGAKLAVLEIGLRSARPQILPVSLGLRPNPGQDPQLNSDRQLRRRRV